MFDFIENAIKKSVSFESGLKYNPSMIKNVAMPIKCKDFFRDLEVLSFEKMIKKYAETPLYVKGYWFVKKYGGKMLRKMGLKK